MTRQKLALAIGAGADSVGRCAERAGRRTLRAHRGEIEVVIFNAGASINVPIREMEARKFYEVWALACFSGFLVGREVARRMFPRKLGTILFTGAIASARGGKGAFASAKHGVRAVAQSMARWRT